MSHTITTHMPKRTDKKEPDHHRDRIDLRVEPEFVRRLVAQAGRFTGGNISAYIRIALVERLERDEATDPRDDG